jgi:hypothetical protein
VEAGVKEVSRRLRDLCEPIAGSVYFVREVRDRYRALGFEDFWQPYFVSRGACLGKPSGEVVTAAFGVFNPAIVIPAVDAGWATTDPDTILRAREEGAVAGLERILGDPDASRAVEILRQVMESVDYAGRMLFAGLRSLPFPSHPLGALWRVCDYVRERRGDGHIAAWVAAGCDAVEISALTELFWGLPPRTYIFTRGWTTEDVDAAFDRLRAKGYVDGDELTDEGRAYRRSIEAATDAGELPVVHALGDDAPELFSILEPLTDAVIEAKGYPVNPAQTMSRDLG